MFFSTTETFGNKIRPNVVAIISQAYNEENLIPIGNYNNSAQQINKEQNRACFVTLIFTSALDHSNKSLHH